MGNPSSDRSWIPLAGSLRVGFQQTLRVPTAGGPYPLPPALGRLPARSASASGAMAALANDADFVVVMHRHEAMWLQFNARSPELFAVKVAVGAVDALSGLPWNLSLTESPQNYIVCPYQPWLDGFKSGAGVVRQFVAVSLGQGESVEHQLAGKEEGGITLACFAPRRPLTVAAGSPRQARRRDLAIGAGGEIQQRVYPDPCGIDAWHAAPSSVVRIRLVEAADYARATGDALPPSAIDADTYSRFGLPWFEIYDADKGDVAVPPALSTIVPAGGSAQDGSETPVTPQVVRPIPPRSDETG